MPLRVSLQKHVDFSIGLAIALLGLCIYLPKLGAFPLWDPWEPHYSQVAWEMQQHHTWLDPYYRGANNWWSKPILMLWMLRASFALFWDNRHSFFEHELSARLPFALTAVAGAVTHFDWVRRLFGRYVGALAAVMLLTSTQYLLIGRQVMVDMVMVVSYASAMGYLSVGLFSRDSAASRGRFSGPFLMFWVLSAFAVLAKGLVPPLMTALTLLSYAALTYSHDDHKLEANLSKLALRHAVYTILALLLVGLAIHIVLGQGAWPKQQRELYVAIIAAGGCAAIFLGILGTTAPSRHVRLILTRIDAARGIPIFLLIAAPWYVYMTLRHGWQYWQIFIFFHHLDRARGAIHLPNGSFDFYLRHLAFGLFPWTGLVVGSCALLLGRCHPRRSIAEQRNLFILCSIIAPLAFLMSSGTKFGHYVFPILPACTVAASAAVGRLMCRDAPASSLEQPNSQVDSIVALHAPDRADDVSNQGNLTTFGLVAFLTTVVLLVDIRQDFRHLLRSFVYYFNRPTPFDYQPATQFTVLALPFVAIAATWMWSRRVSHWHLLGLTAGGVAFACYLSWVTMPAMGATFTYKPLVNAYRMLAKPSDALGQYCTWPQPERSVLFLSQNRVSHLNSDSATLLFLSRPGRKFIIVDRNRLSELKRVAKSINQAIHLVFSDHAYARLVSNEPVVLPDTNHGQPILDELPADAVPTDAQFDGKIQLRGWKVTPERARAGSSIDVVFYYEALGAIDRDWQIFVHGDSPTIPGHRLIADHLPTQGQLPTSLWQEGRLIEDRFTVSVPSAYPHESFFLWTGFVREGERLAVTNSATSDEFSRVRGPLVFVERVKP